MKRVMWSLFMLVIALAAIGAQLDRQSRYHPQLASHVPAGFRSFAEYHLAREAVGNSSPEEALLRARVLAAKRPMPAEHLSLLALAQLRADPNGSGSLTIQNAARRGWRDLQAQQAMLRFALQAGDHSEAAARLAAIMVLAPDEAELAPMATDALAIAGTKEAFAAILASDPRWQTPVILRLARLVPEPVLKEMLDLASRSGANLECSKLQSAYPECQ